jgi:peptidoglycan/LPS O-acetylase OafA/YrhL
MPKPVSSGQRYMPGLDGLRALAVLAVIAYHEQFAWAQGGLLGVGVFFTLSGFLITSLLIGQWSAEGRMRLGQFWLRRARRLLPAVFVMLAVVTAWVTIADRARLSSLRGAVGAAAGYFSNWYIIASKQSYFSRFAPPGPLDHLWSLAVEEQFYLLWPLLLLVGLFVLRKRGPKAPQGLAVPAALLTAASTLAMSALYQPGLDPTRVYEGTDTRAAGLLVGAVLALGWPSASTGFDGKVSPWSRVWLDVLGVAGLAVIGLMLWRVGEYSQFAYHGGMAALSVATAAVVAAAVYPGTLVGQALGWRPLRWIGARSYGIYLWHYPVIVLTTPASAGQNPLRSALQIAAAVALAALSWRYVEEPIRHGAIERAVSRLRAAAGRRGSLRGVLRPAGVAATTGAAGVLVVAGAGLSGAIHAAASAQGLRSVLASGSVRTRTEMKTPASQRKASPSPSPSPSPGTTGGGPLTTSCRAVAHIGDSTSDGLVSRLYLPKPGERITARYEDVGVRQVITDISGARSVFEVLPGQVNGYDAARAIVRSGFRGCWVIALGTNDTADVAAGSNIGLMTRIERMMRAAHGEPVMWVNLRSLLASGPYAESNMLRWDQTLLKACASYPNMRVYNWAAEAKRSWYISDGIHFTSIGYKHRAQMIADALARAFPQGATSSGCLVSS